MRITKMHGLGNDYIFHRPDPGAEADWHDIARRVSDRHFGAGADGLILALPSDLADLRMRMFNADGTEAEMCGNGIRCLAKFAVEEGMAPADSPRVTIETLAGVLSLDLHRGLDGSVNGATVDMGRPRLDPADLPASVDGPGPVLDYPLDVDGVRLPVALVSMGNPHAIHYTDDVDAFPLEQLGPVIEHHRLFPNRVNVQVVQVLDRRHVKHRVWERGTGITLASGTSAAAVCVASRLRGLTDDRIVDSLPGGDLILEWDGEGPVYKTGPATRVYDAEWFDA